MLTIHEYNIDQGATSIRAPANTIWLSAQLNPIGNVVVYGLTDTTSPIAEHKFLAVLTYEDLGVPMDPFKLEGKYLGTVNPNPGVMAHVFYLDF